jgi:hypothetical protein
MRAGQTGIQPDLFRAYAENLRKAVGTTESSLPFGEGRGGAAYGNPYFSLEQRLQANVTRFAAYKAWNATQQLAAAQRKAGDEKEFRRQAIIILGAFNRYQAAEYNTATARARTARQWTDFADPRRGGRLYPNLKWMPSASADPREEHRAFWGLVLPKSDPFWQRNQPGNLWNCKCDWEETDESANAEAPDRDIHAAGLDGNPALTGEIFTGEAAYFKAAERQRDRVDHALLDLKGEGFFRQRVGEIPVGVHVLHNPGEIAGNLETLAAFLNGRNDVKKVDLLPVISPENIARRANFYPEGHAPRGKWQNADALITFADGRQWVADFKTMQGNGGKLRDRLKDSYEQADYAIIKIKGTPDIGNVVKMADAFMKQHGHFKEVFIYDNAENLICHKSNVPKK